MQDKKEHAVPKTSSLTAPAGATGFRKSLCEGEILAGTFMKFPVPHPTEIMGAVGFDFVVLDEEHAPWDRGTIDTALLGARAAGITPIVRVSEPTAARILSVLDDGATGVLVPHVTSGAQAAALAAACRYRGGKRGFANTNRAGDYGGRGLWQHVDLSDAATTFIAMIEDVEALDHLDAILATDGLDAVFIGRGDLTVSMGATAPDAPEIIAACDAIIAAAARAGKPVAVMVGNGDEARRFRAMGASCFIIGSDQTFLRSAAARAQAEIAALRNDD